MSALAGAGPRIAAGIAYRVALPASALAATIALAAAVGVGIGIGQPLAAAAAAVVPLALVGLLTVALKARWLLVLAAIGIAYVGAPLSNRFGVGPVNLWASDLLIALAFGGWLAEWLSQPRERRPRLPRNLVLGVPLFLLAVTLLIAAARGSERYGASLIGMPLRLVLYAVIAMAMTNVTPRQALRGLTFVFYAGVLFQLGVAAYHIATGTSATENLNLSTGGIRYIGIGPATYAAASVLLALLNLASSRKHRSVHLTFLAISCFVVLVAYTRTVWLIIGIEVIVALLVSGAIRRAAAASIPVVTPFLVIGVLTLATVKPDLIQTFTERLSTPAGQDSSVQWREYAYQAVLSGVSEERLLGVGFGRITSFSLNNQPNYITGDPHNGYIYVYAGGGILALAALILVMLVYLGEVARRWRWADEEGRKLTAFSLGVWVLFMGHAAAEPVFTEPMMILTIWIATLLPALVAAPRGEPRLARGRRAAQPAGGRPLGRITPPPPLARA